ncbi:hypothetical protein PIB30_114247, partial [Stylosanthes scabra]|nr:hypothetical protein [Stylosanthes scabra]
MKRNIQEAPQQEQEAPQQEEEAQPQEPQPQPSEQPSDQPSLRDIMQAIQAMELNMNQRMDKIEKNQGLGRFGEWKHTPLMKMKPKMMMTTFGHEEFIM